MKKLLVAFFAVMSAASVSAYYIKIDNDADGKDKTDVIAMTMLSTGLKYTWSQPLIVRSGREKKFRNLSAPIRMVRVKGTHGVGAGQTAFYRIPENMVGKNIKIDVDVKNGSLQLSLDKR